MDCIRKDIHCHPTRIAPRNSSPAEGYIWDFKLGCAQHYQMAFAVNDWGLKALKQFYHHVNNILDSYVQLTCCFNTCKYLLLTCLCIYACSVVFALTYWFWVWFWLAREMWSSITPQHECNHVDATNTHTHTHTFFDWPLLVLELLQLLSQVCQKRT